jgi:2-keto-4-pentenoate hydratase/2-oxohepta-3-ene-1,7-dioic acid hydratase in catechol pathway
MKIARILSTDGQVLQGAFDAANPYEIKIIEGDLFGHCSISGKTAKIKELLAPIAPPNIYALGLNYRRHADETKISYPDIPVLFIKATTSLAGPGSTILLPKAGPEHVDYECELAIVIGQECKNISPGEAFNYIFGYTCANDISARDWQMQLQKGQWARGKSFDTFCPIGPFIATKDEIPDPDNLRIRTILNGATMQNSNTSDMIFDVANIVSDLSRSITLLPGTLILTGTPEGVGFTRNPPVFLNDGDIITIAIDSIGELTNTVKREA